MADLGNTEKAFLDEARRLSDPHQRAVFLDSVCAGNAELRRRLEALLASPGEAPALRFRSAR